MSWFATSGRTAWREVLEEALAGVAQRPGRSLLTVLGTVLGTGSFVAVLGITSTANGQIAGTFNALSATTVQVRSEPAVDGSGTGFPADAEDRIGSLRGVRSAAVVVSLYSPGDVSKYPPGGLDVGGQADVVAVSDGYWRTSGVRATRGRVFTGYLGGTDVAVVSESLVRRLGLDVSARPTLFVEGVAVVVVGSFLPTQRSGLPDATVLVPTRVAQLGFIGRRTAEPPVLQIRTRVGAAGVVADQAALALDRYHPERFNASTGVEPTVLRDRVSDELATLFLVLALVCLVIGAFGIANTSLVAVIERIPEIGLRRALGARPGHVAVQFLLESAVLGGVGGLIGAVCGVSTVLSVAAANSWTPAIAPWILPAAPVAGLVVGVVAGLYPSIRASQIEPVAALSR